MSWIIWVLWYISAWSYILLFQTKVSDWVLLNFYLQVSRNLGNRWLLLPYLLQNDLSHCISWPQCVSLHSLISVLLTLVMWSQFCFRHLFTALHWSLEHGLLKTMSSWPSSSPPMSRGAPWWADIWQWSPEYPGAHRHLFTPRHSPPLRHGTTHWRRMQHQPPTFYFSFQPFCFQ